MTRSFFAALLGSVAIVFCSAPSSAQNAYITNSGDNTVSVIDTATNTVVGLPISVGSDPFGVAVTSDGSKVYVTNRGDNTVSVITTATNSVTATIPPADVVGGGVTGVAVSPDGSKIYVASTNNGEPGNAVWVIDTATNTVTATIPMPSTLLDAFGIAVTPDGSKVYHTDINSVGVIDTATDTQVDVIEIPCPGDCVYPGIAVTPSGRNIYVSEFGTNHVWVIDTATNTVVGSPILVGFDSGSGHYGVAVTSDGSKVYVTNGDDNPVSVISTATNTVVAVLPVGIDPAAYGVFIQPRFAGTPGNANCHDSSTSALAQTFGGLKPAAIALGFPTVQGLQTAVNAFCSE